MAAGLERKALADWYVANRRLSQDLFAVVNPEGYLDRPIPLRNPIVFYEGHLPAFNVNTLLKRALGRPGINSEFEVLFERGIDPEDTAALAVAPAWPPRDAIQDYGMRVDRAVLEVFEGDEIEREDNPLLRRGLAAFTILEHEPMHQETLKYMWHQLPYEKKTRPAGARAPIAGGAPPAEESVRIPSGRATLGASPEEIPFGWDNEFPRLLVEVPAFEMDVHDVTNAGFLDFVEAGGYGREDLWSSEGWKWVRDQKVAHPLFWERRGDSWIWRGMFEDVALPPGWPVYVSHAEASAYARWKGKRLPTEAEYHRAAYGTPGEEERPHPWGKEPPDESRGNFDGRHWDPLPVGSFPAGRSAWGIQDLVGN
ncbi:MAG TPA: SUMF1/EgtB/PvdO family nonheme iron enzyme, partial [Thermoanaerobaculia bacterium]|nr:SUMF1/EgtB/PvdO family nonheme iron enzyme [Thermoanaerobaculia bacterium]